MSAGAACRTARGSPTGRSPRSSARRPASTAPTRPRPPGHGSTGSSVTGRTNHRCPADRGEVMGIDHGTCVPRRRLSSAVRPLLESLARDRPLVAVVRGRPLGGAGAARPRRATSPSAVTGRRSCSLRAARPDLLERRPAWGEPTRTGPRSSSSSCRPRATDRLLASLLPGADLPGLVADATRAGQPRGTRSSPRSSLAMLIDDGLMRADRRHVDRLRKPRTGCGSRRRSMRFSARASIDSRRTCARSRSGPP